MRTYAKRIAFLVSYQTLIPHGGIGQFTKSFIELMDDHNIKVDIITDKKPQDSEVVKSINANVIYPDESLLYTDHSAIFMYGDSYCFERMSNFRNAIIKALSTNLYDSMICNTYETIQVASTMGLEDVIQIIAYTHLESQIFKDTKNPFLYNVNELMRKQLELNGIDKELYETTEIGNFGTFNGVRVPLDIPMETEEELNEAEYHGKEVKLNHPMRNNGSGKKYYVYVKNPKTGKVKKISFGDVKGGLTAKVSDPKARKAFASRHNCDMKKDKTTAGYWACRLTKYGHLWKNGQTYPGFW
jgi:hypothetical protein